MECITIEKSDIYSKKQLVILHLIRHGYAEHNKGYDMYGSRAYLSDKYRFSKLVDKGIDQAKQLEKIIKTNNICFDMIYTSPLDRTMQTTSILFNNSKSKILVTDDLRELNYAHPANERKTISSLKMIYPNFDYSLIDTDNDYFFTNGDIHNRFISMIDEIKNLRNSSFFDPDKVLNIALVSHESFLLEFAKDYLHLNIKSIDNCEIVSYKIDINEI
jgi:broad specificity phosphatase PhoE